MSLYKDIILDHYHSPHNEGILKKPDADVKVVNSVCGDTIRVTLHCSEGTIHDVKFSGQGCAVSIASASMLTDAIKGRSVKTAEKLTKDDVLQLLSIKLTPGRLKCALLPLEAIHKALAHVKE